jgi:hypothetical protein
MSTTAAVLNAHATHDHPIGRRRYVYSTNHKDIGTMYLVFAIAAGVIGAVFSILIRLELQEPGLQIFSNPHYYNVIVSAHDIAATLEQKQLTYLRGKVLTVSPLTRNGYQAEHSVDYSPVVRALGGRSTGISL